MIGKINIGTDVDVPKFLDTRGLFTCTSGGGKSYLLRQFTESMAKTGIQQILIDPDGEFSTLREKFPMALISKDGEIPLSISTAAILAHKLLETNLSAIIDLYELPPSGRILFVKKFLDALINADKKLHHPCVVYLDEADKFAPERKENESTSSVINLCAMGRKRGLCAVLATQRLAKLSKDAAAELLNKFIGLTGMDIDRKRAGEELGLTSKAEILDLKKLPPGVFYASGPAVGYEMGTFKVKKVITSHPESGSRITVTPPTPNAIKKILKKLGDIPQEAARDLETKEQLRGEVTRLTLEVKRLSKAGGGVVDRSAEIQGLKQQIKDLHATIAQLEGQVKRQQGAFKTIEQQIRPFLGDFKAIPAPVAKEVVRAPDPVRKSPPKAEEVQRDQIDNAALGAGPEKMLKVLAMFGGQIVSKERLSLLAGYSLKSSTFGIYIGRLKQFGYVVGQDGGLVITNDGLQTAGGVEPFPTDSQSIISLWLKKLPAGPGKMFTVLTDYYPSHISRGDLSAESGYSQTSSTFGIYLGKLKALGLVEQNGKMLKAADALYQ